MLPTIITVNPMKKRRRSRIKTRHHRRSSAARRHHNYRGRMHRKARRRVNNPFSLGGFSLKADLVPALVGGAGAVGVDIALAYASPYLPAFLTSGWGRLLAQTAAAVAVGMAAGAAIDKRTGAAVTAGGLVVTAYSGLRQALAPTLGQSIKGLSGLADFSDYTNSGWSGVNAVSAPPLSAYMPNGAYMRAGAYMPQGAYMPRLGYMNPAPALGPGVGIRGKQAMLAGLNGFGCETEMMG